MPSLTALSFQAGMESSTKSFVWLAHFGTNRSIISDQRERNAQLYLAELLPLLPAAKGTAKHRQAMAEELGKIDELEKSLTSTPLPSDLPLLVLVREDKTLFSSLAQAQVPAPVIDNMEFVWVKAQMDLAAQTTRGECFEIPSAGPVGHLMAQQQPAEVASAIARILNQL
jgi:hypothetical protein